MDYKNNFIYLSEIIGLPLVDSKTKKRIGRVVDVLGDFKEFYPKATGIIVQKNKKHVLYIPWKLITKINPLGEKILIDSIVDESLDRYSQIPADAVPFKKSFFDRQIINVSGAKVMRVNDLHFLMEKYSIWLVHFDVGIKGLLRRLGFLTIANSLLRILFSYELNDVFIPWKHAQVIESSDLYNSHFLKIPYDKLTDIHPADLADILGDLGNDDRMMVFESLDDATAAKALQEVPIKIRIQVAEEISTVRLVKIINEMEMDEVVDLVENLDHVKVKELFPLLPVETIAKLKELLAHSGRRAGSIMNTECIYFRKDVLIKEVFRNIKKQYYNTESIYYIYVVDSEDRLAGVVTLRDIITSKSTIPLSEIMQTNLVAATMDTHIKKVAQIFFKYNFQVIPVVDEENRIKGIITIKDAFEAVFPEIKKET